MRINMPDLWTIPVTNREIIFQLIKIIGEFYYILIRSLARIRISLLIFDLKIEITIKDILKIRYIKFPVDGDILQIKFFFFYVSTHRLEFRRNKF
jgi:hypothetical protein